ncbi:hypothetical protein [Paenibacillus cymbidii]|uniref:hypothetical protein n=1 Tax=Paenibacillus cymbidii TaxID=1639034 RepID=UPI0010811414|nr:hypothetical protein [Paenibacillus cymbidii]
MQVEQSGKSSHIPLKSCESLYGELRIVRIGDRLIRTGKAIIDVEKISLKGMRFECDFRFPVNPQIGFAFTIRIMDEFAYMPGTLVWSEKQGVRFEYEAVFQTSEPMRKQLLRLLYQLAMQSIPAYRQADYYYHFLDDSTFDLRRGRVHFLA